MCGGYSDKAISVFSLPDLKLLEQFGLGVIGVGENNLTILKHEDGRTLLYVSDDHNVHIYDTSARELLGSFEPPVSSIETMLANDCHQVVYVPEEQGHLHSLTAAV